MAQKTILVMSGKGGVGKTTTAVNLAYTMAETKAKVGILDVDVHGPNVPKMLGLDMEKLEVKNDKMQPVRIANGLKVMSMAFLLDLESDSVIWRGPMKHNVIKQFLEEVEWGELDYLVVDFPPGTGDECISAAQLASKPMGVVIVSTPQQVALLDAKKSIDFARKFDLPVIGMIENMSGGVFGADTTQLVAKQFDVPYLGAIALDQKIVEAGDSGVPFISSQSANAGSFDKIAVQIKSFFKQEGK